MTKVLPSQSAEAKHAIAVLLGDGTPVLVEVRFPSQGTSPDWYLYEEESQLEHLLNRLGPGVEVHVCSVWDLKTQREICLGK